MWEILIFYVAIFALFFRLCIKPLQHKYANKPDEDIEFNNNSFNNNSSDIITNPAYSYMPSNIYHSRSND